MSISTLWRAWQQKRQAKKAWREERLALERDRAHRRKVAELRADVAAETARAAGLRLIAKDDWQAPWTRRDALEHAADADAKAARARVLLQHYSEETP